MKKEQFATAASLVRHFEAYQTLLILATNWSVTSINEIDRLIKKIKSLYPDYNKGCQIEDCIEVNDYSPLLRRHLRTLLAEINNHTTCNMEVISHELNYKVSDQHTQDICTMTVGHFFEMLCDESN